jgi:hypothetical protein
MFDTKILNISVIMGEGRGMKVAKTGNLRVKFAGKNGEIIEVLMRDVKYIPSLIVNLFSLTLALQRGARMYSEGTSVILEKEGKSILFDNKMSIGTRYLMAARAIKTDEKTHIISERKRMKLEKLHRMIGHASIELTKKTASRLVIQLIGDLKTCKDCVLAKTKRKNLNKVSHSKSTKPGERLLLDIRYIKKQSLGEKNMWLLIEDQAISMKWSSFMRRKYEMVEISYNFLKNLKLKDPGMAMLLRTDNVGEIISLKRSLKKRVLTSKSSSQPQIHQNRMVK